MKNSKKLFLNIDINSVTTPFLNAVSDFEAPTEEDLYPFIDIYADTQITDVTLNNFCQFSATPSKIFDSSVDIYLRKIENGIPVDHREKFRGIYKLTTQHGMDPYKIWIDRCRNVGLNPWLSIRMNDCHCPDEETCFLRSEFFYESREKGFNVGDRYGYYRYCFDYAHPEVRKKMLDYIEEQILYYDVFGIELDFMRDPICFDYVNNKDCAGIMNDFMREVKKLVSAAEKCHGHRIMISARLMRDIDQNLIFGFDAKTWAIEGLVDSVTVTPRWDTCDSNMPLAEWKTALPEIEIYGGIEANVNYSGIDFNTVYGYAATYLSDGVDGINLFNYFRNPHYSAKKYQTPTDIFNVCGSLETLKPLYMRHILTFQDTFPEGTSPFRPFPIIVEGETKAKLSIKTSIFAREKKLSLVIGLLEGDICDLTFKCDTCSLENFEVAEGRFFCKNQNVKFYKAEIQTPCDGIYQSFDLSVRNDTKVVVYYAEIQAI